MNERLIVANPPMPKDLTPRLIFNFLATGHPEHPIKEPEHV